MIHAEEWAHGRHGKWARDNRNPSFDVVASIDEALAQIRAKK